MGSFLPQTAGPLDRELADCLRLRHQIQPGLQKSSEVRAMTCLGGRNTRTLHKI